MLSYNEICSIEQVQRTAKESVCMFAGSSDKRRLSTACDIVAITRSFYYIMSDSGSTEKDKEEAKEQFIRNILSLT
jgi:hypothetical protein